MESINHLINGNYLPCIYLISKMFSSTCLPEISSMKYYYEYAASRWKPDESKTKELELVGKPVTTESEICTVTEPTNGPPDPIHKNQHKEDTTSGYKTDSKDEEKKRFRSAFTSERKKNSEQDNSTTEAEGAIHSSFDTCVNGKPVEDNWRTIGLNLEIHFTDKTFMQICAVGIAFILIGIFGSYYYIKEMRSTVKHVNEVMTRAQAVAHSMAEEVSSSQRYPESDEEMEPISNNDELAMMTSSSMVYCHLQNLADEIKKSKPEENLEKYLTEDFLQLIAARIAQDDFMKLNFQKLLPAETLLQHAQLHYYIRNRNSGYSERVSSHLESNERMQGHCNGKSKHQDVKVNIGVQVGGQEIKIPQSKTEEGEEKKEKSSD